MTTLTTTDKDRLLSLLRKMLETSHDGEAMAVLNLIKRDAEKRGMATVTLLEQVLGTRIQTVVQRVVVREPARNAAPVWEEPRSSQHGLLIALRFEHALNDWERSFARDCAGRDTLSEKQEAKAKAIIRKARLYAGA